MKRIYTLILCAQILSFPSRERGLKQWVIIYILHAGPVVPLAGTWIETESLCNIHSRKIVVPLAGTWIETTDIGFFDKYIESFPSRERGLKLPAVFLHLLRNPVVPLAGTWIETAQCSRLDHRLDGRSPRGNVD